MDIEKTRAFYAGLGQEDICQCAYCRNYVNLIRVSYPGIAAYLQTLGIDSEKPFETIPLEPENGYIDYVGGQYIVFGRSDAFSGTTIDGVNITVTTHHPHTAISEAHFVIELYPVRLRWTM